VPDRTIALPSDAAHPEVPHIQSRQSTLKPGSAGRHKRVALIALAVALSLLAAAMLAWARSPPQTNIPIMRDAHHARGAVQAGIIDRSAKQPSPAMVPDPQAARSAPAAPSVHHVRALAPAYAAVAAGAPSDAEVRSELKTMSAAVRAERDRAASGGGEAARIAANGTVTPRAGVPLVVAQVIAGANAITNFPYVFGGGHGSFTDKAYDCSGSVSYALAAGGLLSAPQTSGAFETWGAPGPGRWITIYANAGHMYMIVDGLRYDTSGRTGVFSTRWQTGPDPGAGASNAGMVVRHYPGL
jgi:cell wall-associated NlpC family hydrolase